MSKRRSDAVSIPNIDDGNVVHTYIPSRDEIDMITYLYPRHKALPILRARFLTHNGGFMQTLARQGLSFPEATVETFIVSTLILSSRKRNACTDMLPKRLRRDDREEDTHQPALLLRA